MNSSVSFLRVEELTFRYRSTQKPSLENVSLNVSRGERCALIGPSGAGKTTLLKCINRLLKPATGRVILDERIIWSGGESGARPSSEIAMIFQEYALVERLSALDNVLIGRLGRVTGIFPFVSTLAGYYPESETKIAMECLHKVGLSNQASARVDMLSGGQRQRVNIARALAQRPQLILADEPVSSLDPPLMRTIMKLLVTLCQIEAITLIVSLHSVDLVREYATSVIGMKNGKVVFAGAPTALNSEMLASIYESQELDLPTSF